MRPPRTLDQHQSRAERGTGISRRSVLGAAIIAGAIAAGSLSSAVAFKREMARARAMLANRSSIIQTRFGALEYAEAGAGRPVLMIHGTGGGFDQGLTFAEPLIARDYRVIAPSRFGYLRSGMPADASPEAQADAFVDLLEALNIERIPVLGGSAGALSALAFAIRYPDRCSALVPIVPATHVPDRPPPPALSPLATAIMDHALGSDFWFWCGQMAARRSMIATVLATDPDLVDRADANERVRVDRILREILPISARERGMRNDARLTADPGPVDLGRIQARTLVISLEDDRFGTFAAAQHIARNVLGARFLSWTTGGHVWVGHDREMFEAIDEFLRETAR